MQATILLRDFQSKGTQTLFAKIRHIFFWENIVIGWKRLSVKFARLIPPPKIPGSPTMGKRDVPRMPPGEQRRCD